MNWKRILPPASCRKVFTFWDIKLLRTTPSLDVYAKTMRTTEKMVFILGDHLSPPTEMWKPSKLCRISFSFVHVSSQKTVCKAKSRVWVVVWCYRQSLKEQKILLFRTWVLFVFYIHLWGSKQKDLSLNPLFTDKLSLETGSPVLSKTEEWLEHVLRHLKPNFHVKTFPRASLPNMNSLTSWRSGGKKKKIHLLWV